MPSYIEIHAALAGIFNTSGAGRFFDELLDKIDEAMFLPFSPD
jgi:hypothetical protein